MANRVHVDDFAAVSQLILDIQALESRAHRLKMVAAAQALNKAQNTTGWELAEQTEKWRATHTSGKQSAP